MRQKAAKTAPHGSAQRRSSWSDEDHDRLGSYLPQLLIALRPDRKVEDLGYALSSGSIKIQEDGRWVRYSNGAWGNGALPLLVELHRKDHGPKAGEAAETFARAWLAEHPGRGAWEGGDEQLAQERDATIARRAAGMLGAKQPIPGTPASLYLTGRGVPVREGAEVVLGYVPDTVPNKGFGALIGVLTNLADPQVALGVQQLNVDALGAPELNANGRKRKRVFFRTRDRELRRQAVFRIPPLPSNGPVPPGAAAPDQEGAQGPVDGADLAGITIITEGLENALAIAHAAPYSAVLGIPGIGRLRRLAITGRVIVMRDNDGDTAPATQALTHGVDELRLGGADVSVTDTPLKRDAADYAKDGAWDDLRKLLTEAKPVQLSRDGEIARLARLYVTDYLAFGAECERTAKRLDIKPTALLRQTVENRVARDLGADGDDDETQLAAARAEAQAKAKAAGFIGQDDVWPTPVTNISEVCEEMLVKVRTYWVTTELNGAVAVIWSALTHFIHDQTIVIEVGPRLMIRGKSEVCGKTRALLVIRLLCPRVRMDVSTTASSFAELANLLEMTLFLDEFDKLALLHTEDELGRVILGSHEREFASVSKMIPDGDGGWVLQFRRVWLTLAGTCIGQLPNGQIESRCIFLDTVRATADQRPAPFPRRRCAVLTEGRQKLGRWAADLTELPAIKLPAALLNRDVDNWVPLMQVAAAVGGRFPALIEQAALEALTAKEPAQDVNTAFLADLRTVIQGKEWMWSETIAAELCALDEPNRDWSRAYNGTPITDIWVGRKLKHWVGKGQTERFDLEGKTDEQDTKDKRQRRRGIRTSKLQPVFDIYLDGPQVNVSSKTTVPTVPTVPDGKDVDPNREKPWDGLETYPSQAGGYPSQEGPTDHPQPRFGTDGTDAEIVPANPSQEKSKIATAFFQNRDGGTVGTVSGEGGDNSMRDTQPPIEKLSSIPAARRRPKANGKAASKTAKAPSKAKTHPTPPAEPAGSESL